jgi:hypothetical protein
MISPDEPWWWLARSRRGAASFDHNTAIARASSEKRIHIISSVAICGPLLSYNVIYITIIYIYDIRDFI